MITATGPLQPVNERLLEEAKKVARVYLDTYQSVGHELAQAQARVAGATYAEFVKAGLAAQAKLTREVTDACTAAAREVLK